jgi:hypothetical protein
VGVRYYSGIHDPRINPDLNAALQRRHALMRRMGVSVIERKLRYRWEWGFDIHQLPDPRKHKGESRQASVTPYERAREKGIDLALGLDVVDLALDGHMHAAIIVSSDTDLTEVARVAHDMTGRGQRVSVEAAVFNDRPKPLILEHYDYTHQIRRKDFEATRDGFYYASPLVPAETEMFLSICRSEARAGSI